ncbi:hypothetical protein PVAP13_7NG106589 [Panicum virgatum]|uniref:Uncharacterized protein n=1 Tax=Panicum virgatum TaxID=38727 RepID=A0A8T0PUG5_PANVG|nr:hypothetical protein PVAP13_7NG106589 [Panicum virgatum]
MAWRAVEDVIEKSRQKSEMLRDVGDAILRAEKLEEELKKAKQQASNLQIRLDRNAVEYHNEVQALTAAKDGLVDQNKSLTAQKNELVEKNKKLRQKETELKNSVA